MVSCHRPHDCTAMSEKSRDRILSSGPSRFQRLSAFHPGISSRLSANLGSKLSNSFPSVLFETICKLEVVIAHMGDCCHSDNEVYKKTQELMRFCYALSNIYQVLFLISEHERQPENHFIVFTTQFPNPKKTPKK